MYGWWDATMEALGAQDRRLAYEAASLSGWSVEGEHERVYAAVPGLVAAARRLSLPWLEVYARHWRLQSLVLKERDVGEGLGEAVSLVERAHRADAAECPQSVCTTQDLCAAYGVADGPGYAEVRAEASRETLARIDPTWPCWRCIGCELADALVDAGRPQEALDWLGERFTPKQRQEALVIPRALNALGRHADALQVLDQLDLEDLGVVVQAQRDVLRAWSLTRLGRPSEAAAALPAWDAALEKNRTAHLPYVETLASLRRSGALEASLELTRRVADIARELEAKGALRDALRVALTWGELELELEDRSVSLARVFAAKAEELLPRLQAPHGDDARLVRLQDLVASLEVLPFARTPEEVQARLGEEGGQDGLGFDDFDATARAVPGHLGLVQSVAAHWERRGWPEEAVALLEHAWQAAPPSGDLLFALGRALLGAGRLDDAEDLCRDLLGPAEDVTVPWQARWVLSLVAEERGDLATAASLLQEMESLNRAICGEGFFRREARLLFATGEVEAELAAWEAVIEEAEDKGPAHWNRLTAATVHQRWALVRTSARALGMELDEGDAPIDEDWGYVRLVLSPDQTVYARRTGPATARVMSITCPQEPERYGELWAYEPIPLPLPEDEEEDKLPSRFRSLARLEAPPVLSTCLDGWRLSPDQDERLRRYALSLGGAAFRASTEGYRMAPPPSAGMGADAEDNGVPASYYRIALPADRVSPQALHAWLEGLALTVEGPLVWVELARKLGNAPELARQEALAAAWSL